MAALSDAKCNYEGIGHCALGYAAEPLKEAALRKINYIYYVEVSRSVCPKQNDCFCPKVDEFFASGGRIKRIFV